MAHASADEQPAKAEVASPGLSNSNALVRFEFEAGHGQEGTKILMVEWEDDETTRGRRGEWHISWEDQSPIVLHSDDQTGADVKRLYFLLQSSVPVPPAVTLAHHPTDPAEPIVTWHVNSLPAIFSPKLGVTARQAGKKGVLHTIWAKRRLRALQEEIDAEARTNVEGVAFVLAMQEKTWIEQNFGVSLRLNSGSSLLPGSNNGLDAPSTPRSPGGGRLMEKLRGLSIIDTTEQDSATCRHSMHQEGSASGAGLLSPESSDVAVSSFASFKENPAVLAAKSPQPPSQQQKDHDGPTTRRVAAAAPPPELVVQQRHQMAGMGSLNALAGGPPSASRRVSDGDDEDEDREEDLFVIPISPRSPDMAKRPFSFDPGDSPKYGSDRRAL